jgi:hypothetical protein
MRSHLALLVLASTLLPVPSFADTVYLKNGRTFEGVLAEASGSSVRIRMAGATLSLAADNVMRIEKGEAPFALYASRRDALRRNPDAGAADWLELAAWARRNGLESSVRESALAAADLDPKAPGLAPLLRSLGYVFDEPLDRYIPYADAMRGKGFVYAEGQWISREENRQRMAQREEDAARLRAEREARASRAAEARRAAELAQLAQAQAESRRFLDEQQAAATIFSYSAPLYVMPGFYYPPAFQPPGHGREHGSSRPSGPSGYDRLLTRPPGSLLPGLVPNSPHSGSRSRR